MTMYDEQLSILISNALKEDIGAGDYSTLSTINADKEGSAILKIKQCTFSFVYWHTFRQRWPSRTPLKN